jgi:hypothetical protein
VFVNNHAVAGSMILARLPDNGEFVPCFLDRANDMRMGASAEAPRRKRRALSRFVEYDRISRG